MSPVPEYRSTKIRYMILVRLYWILVTLIQLPFQIFVTFTKLFRRNQNPWREIDFSAIKKNQIQLVRRNSGGGTVYHDEGNLNYCFMMPRNEFDRSIRFVACLREILILIILVSILLALL